MLIVDLPFGIYDHLFPLVGCFSLCLFHASKVSIKPIIFWKEMAGSWIWRIDHCVVNVLVILANSISESGLLNVFSVAHLVL